jgi:hypothetical protein
LLTHFEQVSLYLSYKFLLRLRRVLSITLKWYVTCRMITFIVCYYATELGYIIICRTHHLTAHMQQLLRKRVLNFMLLFDDC